MKIRHKQSGVELEGSFCICSEGCGDGRSKHYFAPHLGKSVYSADEWEEVAPKWVDVTGECKVNRYDSIIMCGELGIVGLLDDEYRYRIRKVEAVMSGYPHPQYFIIERKEPA